MTRAACAALLIALLLTRAAAQGPPRGHEAISRVVVSGESRVLLGRFDAAARHAARGAWPEALDEYQRLIDEFGDELVPVDTPRDRAGSTSRSLQVRRLCHLHIAALPPEAQRLYRARMDRRAEGWLREGEAQRDPKPLRRVADEAFCTRSAERCLLLLGDLAFERGDFAAAGSWYRLLALPPTASSDAFPAGAGPLLFPAPADAAAARARQVLTLLFQGDLAAFDAERAAFERLHPNARGKLAGREGSYADILQAVRRERGDIPLWPEEAEWATFGGSPSRGRAVPVAPAEQTWAEGPAWRVTLVPAEQRLADPRPITHPGVASGQVIFADARHVTAVDARTGRRAWHHSAPGNDPADGIEPDRLRELSHTVSAVEGRVYARLGSIWVGPPVQGEAAGESQSRLVCLPTLRGTHGEAVEPLWSVTVGGARGERAAFEGAPLVHANRAYAVVTTVAAGGMARVTLLAYDAEKGSRLWSQDVGEVPEFAGRGPRCRHHLLTLSGDSLVYCTHAGVVIAVDTSTGKPLWAVRYLRRQPEGPSSRPPSPCVSDGHRVFVAPLDGDRLLCLDASTGSLLWEREGIAAVSILGVAQGRLLLTTTGGVRALDAATGADARGWRQPATGQLGPLGRGLLAGGQLFWPTQDARLAVRALRAEDGEPVYADPSRLHRLVPGNLALGGGCLVVAGSRDLVGYRLR